ncbi:unnamed protein product [Meganyctiphanes norvegica]|uniref:Uncharacterized protein n=1 Tax=Meganyctiphanes norvegica TaxID=48144 RepID=A0AAV2SKF8_MEGNR
MKVIVLACLVAVAACAPQDFIQPVAILRQETTGEGANFQNIFESDDGILVEASGSSGSAGQANLAGRYIFTAEDGSQIEVTYIADENGFQPQGAHLPVGPAAPAHVADLLRIAEEQRAQGIEFDQQGFRLN